MLSRVYTFMVGVEQSTQPDPGTPSDPSDIVPLSYMGTPVEQEELVGDKDNVNETFTVAYTPLAHWPFALQIDGTKQKLTTDYTRSGSTITIPGGLAPNQRATADYRRSTS